MHFATLDCHKGQMPEDLSTVGGGINSLALKKPCWITVISTKCVTAYFPLEKRFVRVSCLRLHVCVFGGGGGGHEESRIAAH